VLSDGRPQTSTYTCSRTTHPAKNIYGIEYPFGSPHRHRRARRRLKSRASRPYGCFDSRPRIRRQRRTSLM
jgi:hypothetical protein